MKTRTITSAKDGITDSERLALCDHYRLWQERHLRTAPIQLGLITDAIHSLYRIAGLKTPRVIVVSSPGALAFAGSFASWIWNRRLADPSFMTNFDSAGKMVQDFSRLSLPEATRFATLAAISTESTEGLASAATAIDVSDLTQYATYSDADLATATATDRQTYDDIYSVVEDLLDLMWAVDDAMIDPFKNSTPTPLISRAVAEWGRAVAQELFKTNVDIEQALKQVGEWFRYSSRGNAGAYGEYRISAARDILGLQLPEFTNYTPWEQCAIQGCYRYMHTHFCIVSDFPCEITEKKEQSHTLGTGYRFYRWRDGWVV